MKKTRKSKKNIFKDNIRTIIVGVITVVIVLGLLIYNNFFNTNKTYTVINGSVEKTSDTYAYVLKNEKVLEIDKNNVTIPVIEQDKRTSKGEIVATYKNSKYEEYLNKIETMDREIQTLISDLPATYSSDVSLIDEKVSILVKESRETTSYVKIQEYKNKIDELAYKKVTILGQLSPSGSKIRELIEQREKVEKESKNIASNIKATMSGLVTYKIDELEDVANYDKVLKYDVEYLENIINKYNQNSINNFGIKIIDNFNCYLLVREPRGENDSYIKEKRNYTIKLSDKSNVKITSVLVKNIKTEEYNYSIFSIDNGIENLLDNRLVNAEVIWTRVSGMVVPTNAIKKDEEKGYDYVTAVNGGEYTNIPVKTVILSDSICIVENMTAEKKEELGIKINQKLSIYDQLMI